jgi:RNA polymerase sigma factor (sigma-70 family)
MGSQSCAMPDGDPGLTPEMITDNFLVPSDEDSIERRQKRAEITRRLWQLMDSDLEEAFKFLILIVEFVVCRAAKRWNVRSDHDLADLVQEVLVRIYKGSHKFDVSRDLRGWVHGITKYAVLDHLEAQKMMKSISHESVEAQASLVQGTRNAEGSEGADRPDVSRLKEVLNSDLFTDDDRRILTYSELTAEELARELGTTAGAIRVRKHRLLEKLRGLFSDHFSDDDRRILTCSHLMVDELARELGTTAEAIRTRKHHLLKRLQMLLSAGRIA